MDRLIYGICGITLVFISLELKNYGINNIIGGILFTVGMFSWGIFIFYVDPDDNISLT